MRWQKGDIFFTKNNSFVSKMIRLVETGKFGQNVPSHNGIIRYISPTTIYILEASFFGVRKATLHIYEKKGATIWLGRMKGERDIQKGILWAESKVGKRYDFTGVVGIWLRSFWRLLGKRVYSRVRKVRNFLNSKQNFWCAEFVEHYSMWTGKRLWHGARTQVTPADQFRSDQLDIEEIRYFH